MDISKEYILTLYDEINKIKDGSVVVIRRFNGLENETLEYKCQYDKENAEYELLNDDFSECWGCGSALLSSMKTNLLTDGIRNKFEWIYVSQ